MVVARNDDQRAMEATSTINHSITATCTKIERDFLKTLLGGCSTPISAYAEVKNNQLFFNGNVLSLDGKEKVSIELVESFELLKHDFGIKAAFQLLEKGGKEIAKKNRNFEK
jgi:hydroxymethylbilane synthase